MTRHHFSLKESFTFGWLKTKQHYWFIALTFILYALILSSASRIPLLNTVTALMVGLSVVSITLHIVRNHSFTFADLFVPLLSPKRVLKFLALSVLYIIPVAFLTVVLFAPGLARWGALFVVVPSVYLMIRFKFFPYVVLEHEDASIKELILMSLKLTKGHFWAIFLFLFSVALFNTIGALTVVGLLVTIPVSIFASAHVYDKLKEHSF